MMPFSPRLPMPSSPRPQGLSKAHAITLGGLTFVPDLSGALHAPELAALLVADLHLEQGAALARRGLALPPYDTTATLAALEAVIAATSPARLFLLGDSFHDAEGHTLLNPGVILRIRKITDRIETVWISGNHDPAPKHLLGGYSAAAVNLADAITLRHEPARRLAGCEIAGHLHPGAGVVQRGHMVRAKCIIADPRRIILPAFGAYTGALSVASAAFDGLFDSKKASVTLLARAKMYRFPLSRVC
jgi:DNA ligase-associated metallophosphoesterase